MINNHDNEIKLAIIDLAKTIVLAIKDIWLGEIEKASL